MEIGWPEEKGVRTVTFGTFPPVRLPNHQPHNPTFDRGRDEICEVVEVKFFFSGDTCTFGTFPPVRLPNHQPRNPTFDRGRHKMCEVEEVNGFFSGDASEKTAHLKVRKDGTATPYGSNCTLSNSEVVSISDTKEFCPSHGAGTETAEGSSQYGTAPSIPVSRTSSSTETEEGSSQYGTAPSSPVSRTSCEAIEENSEQWTTAPSSPVTGTYWEVTERNCEQSTSTAPSSSVTGTYWEVTGRNSEQSTTAPSSRVTGTSWDVIERNSGQATTAPSSPVTGTSWEVIEGTTAPTSPVIIVPIDAEVAFMKSLGWDENTGEVGDPLTQTDIKRLNSFYVSESLPNTRSHDCYTSSSSSSDDN